MDNRERIKFTVDILKEDIDHGDGLLVKAFLKSYNIPNVEDLKEKMSIIETFDYDPELAERLFGEVNTKYVISLISVLYKTMIGRLLELEKSQDQQKAGDLNPRNNKRI